MTTPNTLVELDYSLRDECDAVRGSMLKGYIGLPPGFPNIRAFVERGCQFTDRTVDFYNAQDLLLDKLIVMTIPESLNPYDAPKNTEEVYYYNRNRIEIIRKFNFHEVFEYAKELLDKGDLSMAVADQEKGHVFPEGIISAAEEFVAALEKQGGALLHVEPAPRRTLGEVVRGFFLGRRRPQAFIPG